jgi:hypothetical protein
MPIAFVLYSSLMLFIMLNLFIAVLSRTFVTARRDAVKQQLSRDQFIAYLRSKLFNFLSSIVPTTDEPGNSKDVSSEKKNRKQKRSSVYKETIESFPEKINLLLFAISEVVNKQPEKKFKMTIFVFNFKFISFHSIFLFIFKIYNEQKNSQTIYEQQIRLLANKKSGDKI